MEQDTLPTEIILSHPQKVIASLRLDWNPQPGAYLDLAGQTYRVLERRHRYQLKSGQYRLHKIALYVQQAYPPAERTWVEGCWVLGDANCQYNARSELVRCAINPTGPCEGCRFYKSHPH